MDQQYSQYRNTIITITITVLFLLDTTINENADLDVPNLI